MRSQQPSLQAKTNTCFSQLTIIQDVTGAMENQLGWGIKQSETMYTINGTQISGVAYAERVQMDGHPPIVYYEPIAVLGGGREHSTICMDETAPTLCTFQDSKPILIARLDNAEIL